MTTHRFFVEGERTPPLSTQDFLWSRDGSSFHTSVDPAGRSLGVTSEAAIELLRLAFAVYLVDRTERRPRGWARELDLEIPVSDVGAWEARSEAVAGLLDFLTGDRWVLTFRNFVGAPITRAAAEHRSDHDLVSLFSGGMDSFAGAVRATQQAENPLLIGQWNWTLTRTAQTDAHEALRNLTNSNPDFHPVHVGRSAKQFGGPSYGAEASSRSRSLLFLAIGVAATTGTQSRELWVPENGWVSLNVPLDGSRRGSLSTRTTHPGLLDEFNGLLADLGIDVSIRNPWEGMTKGDLVQWVAREWGPDAASTAFSATNSCAKSDMRFQHLSPNTHCGVCYACLVRRGAFIAAGVVDGTTYGEQQRHGEERTKFLRNRRSDYAAVQGALARGGFALDDVLALSLPTRISPDDTLILANRGLHELATLTIA